MKIVSTRSILVVLACVLALGFAYRMAANGHWGPNNAATRVVP